MISDEQLAALDQAELAATPGPWKYDYGNWQVESENKSFWRNVIADWCGWDERSEISGNTTIDPIADFELIAMSRNHLRELLDEVKTARALTEDAVDILTVQERMPIVDNLRAELVAARAALGEMHGILSAHEYAIRQDSGNTNYAITEKKLSDSIKRIDDTLGDG